MQNTINKSDNLQNSFVYGMGSFFNIFNLEHKKCFKIAEKNNFYFHSSIAYPGASFFYKKNSDNKKSNDKKLILKIAGYSYDQLKFEVDESIKEFKLDQLYGFQLWEKLPEKDEKINQVELKKIISYLEELKKNKIIEKTFFQLEPKKINFDEINFFDGYAFYGYPHELQIDKDQYLKIIENKKILLQFQFFGGRSTKIFRENFKKNINNKKTEFEIDKLWINECLNFSNSISKSNCLFVGCTQKSRRLEFLANIIKKKDKNFKKIQNINFSDNLNFLTQVNYPIKNHPSFLKKIRSNLHLIKLYLRKIIKF